MRLPALSRKRQRGSAIVEFAIAGVAACTMMISTVQLGIAMWNYHTLAYATHETNRYIAAHGRSCTTGGNGCAITVGDIATKFKSYASGIPASKINMTLTTANASYTCNPLSSYTTDTTQWPPSAHSDNWTGQPSTLTATTTINSALVAIWYGWSGQRISSVTLKSTSKVQIVF